MGAHRRKPFGLKPLLTVLALLLGLCGAVHAGTPREIATLRTELAVEYLKQDNLRLALDSAETAVKADPTYMAGFLVRAHIQQLLKLDQDAEASFRKALELAPASPAANNNYGWFLCTRGRVAESLPYFEKALADPLYETPQTAQSNWGMCLSKLGRRDEANEHFLAALRAAPDDPLALRELARLQLEQGNGRLASFYFKRLLRSAPLATPEDLMLGVKVARLAADQNLEAQMVDQLKQRFPDSKETQQLLIGS